jgi:hypothetical protein
LGLNIFFITRIAMGMLVPYNRVEAEQKNTALWQHAWEVKEQTAAEATELVKQLTVTALTVEKLVNALPKAETHRQFPAPFADPS